MEQAIQEDLSSVYARLRYSPAAATPSASAPMALSIIIPAYNEGVWLQKTIDAILHRGNYPDFEIVVVADGCADGSTDFLEKRKNTHYRDVRLVKTASIGLACAKNLGARHARGEGLIFVDAHVAPGAGNWLQALARMIRDPMVGAATIRINGWGDDQYDPRRPAVYAFEINRDNHLMPRFVNCGAADEIIHVPAIPGGCCAVRRTLFREIGGFDEGLIRFWMEDIEFSLRLWRLGYHLLLDTGAELLHRFKHFNRQHDETADRNSEQQRYYYNDYEWVHNILRTGWFLFSPQRWEALRAVVSSRYPDSGARWLKRLEIEQGEQNRARKVRLEAAFTRGFDDYEAMYREMVPFFRQEIENGEPSGLLRPFRECSDALDRLAKRDRPAPGNDGGANVTLDRNELERLITFLEREIALQSRAGPLSLPTGWRTRVAQLTDSVPGTWRGETGCFPHVEHEAAALFCHTVRGRLFGDASRRVGVFLLVYFLYRTGRLYVPGAEDELHARVTRSRIPDSLLLALVALAETSTMTEEELIERVAEMLRC
nr:MAG: Glycosyltransferase, GT2 family [Candidatus Kentron sp. FM]